MSLSYWGRITGYSWNRQLYLNSAKSKQEETILNSSSLKIIYTASNCFAGSGINKAEIGVIRGPPREFLPFCPCLQINFAFCRLGADSMLLNKFIIPVDSARGRAALPHKSPMNAPPIIISFPAHAQAVCSDVRLVHVPSSGVLKRYKIYTKMFQSSLSALRSRTCFFRCLVSSFLTFASPSSSAGFGLEPLNHLPPPRRSPDMT